ncbi:DNA repair ATPase [Streptomyces beihaiensis]|uniref:DNA repair ATPase n=1 Tax=Streptomyces beihaiensis TaxID=2984495 RepID=A0ABT3U208_9ACTN|nr:DNA repair ATPase [Streptomyces beihaiensis]MCX3062637.1 DNA repair ATPase [Streptomyces beihaiensis]
MATGRREDATGTYELLRDRLARQAADLARGAEELNARRIEEFASTRLELAGTDRLRTERPSTPRDLAAVGGHLLLGHDTARTDGAPRTAVGDVLALYDRDLNPLPDDAVPGLLDDPAFVHEFTALHRYYQAARLLRLRLVDGKLLAVFQTGDKTTDIRVLRWALTADGGVRFLDARGDRDDVLPPAHDVTWHTTGREDHVLGRHPHVAVDGEIYVSTVGGSLTVKTENDTETGDGIHSEPVDEPLQSLADADIAYARVGSLLLLRVRPYKESADRHLVYHTLTHDVVRLDGIGRACRVLPDEQGVVFPGGYCLSEGGHKTFDIDTAGLAHEQTVRSPNGEDVLYVFHDRTEGRDLLLSYNTIRKEALAPLGCQGHALLDDGTLVVLRTDAGAEPARVHPVQRYDSPYVTDTYAAAQPVGEGALARIGNADLVRGVADCLSLARAATTATPTSEGYAALLAGCVRAADSHPWLADAEAGALDGPLSALRATAEQIVAEFETVRELTEQAARTLEEAAARITAVVRRLRGEVPRDAGQWVAGLTELRRAQGHLLTLKDLRYVDVERVEELAARAEDDLAHFGQRAVAFLARDDAFAQQRQRVTELADLCEQAETAAGADKIAAQLDELADELRTVTDVVGALDIADVTVRTAILEHIADVLGAVNRVRAGLDARRRELTDHEGRAEFAAQTALLGQAVAGALAAADTPDACDDHLARLLVQVENLQSRFGEFDDFLAHLDAQRTEIHETLAARKQTLLDARARRTEQLATSAARVLDTLARRARALPDADAVAVFFTSDPMAAKVRSVADELRSLGDEVRADDLAAKLTATRQEAARALRDRADLYDASGTTVRLGAHRFAVNTQPFDLTLVPAADGEGLAFALTGTDYRAPVTDPAFADTRPYWNQHLPSESPHVYRAEHLAARLLAEHGATALAAADDLAGLVRQAAQDSYDEGYERGVHDHDATAILATLLRLHAEAGVLRHLPAARAAAQLFWAHATTDEQRAGLRRRATSLARARDTYGLAPAVAELEAEMAAAIAQAPVTGAADETAAARAAAYLFEELTSGPEGFVLPEATRTFLDKFRRSTGSSAYDDDLAAVGDLAARRQLAEGWLRAYAASGGQQPDAGDLAEAVAAEVCPDLPRYGSAARVEASVGDLLGAHPRIGRDRTMTVRIDELLARTEEFRTQAVPAFRAYQQRRTALMTAERERLRVDDLKPRAMASFVRSRLIDEAYLPLIGDSLARQIGTAGENRRADTGGLLLLLSPPGYGKTTLMEYVAERLGLLLVKVDGPALGHQVSSLDPAQAPDATARRELEKINFALAAGNNTLLYLDDIQHTSPELLQRFIPLCDSTRRVDGVVDGAPRTFDLRGKRFAVCMAGNPYTESGARFRIPDMLANRADVWNLGDVLTGKQDAFALSFVENALTSQPDLAPLAGRGRADLDVLVRLAADDPTARPDDLEHPYSGQEVQRITAVLRHLLAARDTVLAVNGAYIASAAQADATRTEPPFMLQGSYRNMNKIAQRLDPAMDATERAAVIDDHYRAEAQTLTTAAEANLLKLAELRATLTAEQADRWAEVKASYVRHQRLGGTDDDPAVRAVAALGLLADRAAAIEAAITRAADPRSALMRQDRT